LNEIIRETITQRGEIITSREIGILTIRIFMQYLFGRFEPDEYHYKCCDELYDASIEFRKEIALKGFGNTEKKNRAVEIIREYIIKSKYNLPNDIYSISVILQPFIISPAINVSDVAINWDLNKSVESNIVRNHPFPILEREVIIDGRIIQVFIPTDELKILPFGYGQRQCTGKAIATTFLETFFTVLIEKNVYRPSENHLFSGRDNDASYSIEETIFQVQTVIRLLR
jgi:hypothetical protein